MQAHVISGISPRFRGLSQSPGQVTHVLLTRSPLEYPQRGLSARLACVKHAASVRPEPGSNSPTKLVENLSWQQTIVCHQRNPRNTKPDHPEKNSPAHATGYKSIGTGLTSTLLSSQTTNTHRCGPR